MKLEVRESPRGGDGGGCGRRGTHRNRDDPKGQGLVQILNPRKDPRPLLSHPSRSTPNLYPPNYHPAEAFLGKAHQVSV